MLGVLRDDSGRPRAAMRGLALLVALLLGLPLTLLGISIAGALADLLW